MQQGADGHGSPALPDSPGVWLVTTPDASMDEDTGPDSPGLRLVTSPDDRMFGYLEDTPPKLVCTSFCVILVLTL